MAENRASVLASTISHKSYPKTAFDSVLLLTDKATFSEPFRVYQDAKGFLADNSNAELQEAGLLLFGQEPKITTVIVAKTLAGSSAGVLTATLVELDRILTEDFFALTVLSSHSDVQLLELAKYVETQEMLGCFYSNTDDTTTTATTSLASKMKALNLRHSFAQWHKTDRLDMAFISRFLGEKVGLVSAKHLVLSGITPSNLSVTNLGNVLAKNANVYDAERKKYIFTKQGVTASNENLESVAGEIFLSVTCIEEMYTLLLNNSRISFNQDDIVKIKAGITKRIQIAQEQKIVAKTSDKGAGYFVTYNPIREESKLEVLIEYLDAGTMKWITVKFTAYKDDTQFNVVRESHNA